MNYSELFRVKPGERVKLERIDPAFKDRHESKESAEAELVQHSQRMAHLQYLLYAENRRSLLICLQAMDAGGKDGVIRHVFGAMNPQGTRVHGFKVPTREETGHDFLWRVHKQTPSRGEVVIFNRSHYEDVLVPRVHNLIPKKVWSRRYKLINDFEKNLFENGTQIIKLFLHISADEQLRRFKQRLDDPMRHWKISEADYDERKLWQEYHEAYEDVLSRTNTRHAPWYVIPSNLKWFRNLAVSRIVADTMESFDMKLPATSLNIGEILNRYHAAENDTKIA